jgi:hypothetical protein
MRGEAGGGGNPGWYFSNEDKVDGVAVGMGGCTEKIRYCLVLRRSGC